MATTVTAEAIFDRHATALGLPTLSDRAIEDYVSEVAGKSEEGARCLGEAFDAARCAVNDEVHSWLVQARQQIDPKHQPKRS